MAWNERPFARLIKDGVSGTQDLNKHGSCLISGSAGSVAHHLRRRDRGGILSVFPVATQNCGVRRSRLDPVLTGYREIPSNSVL